MWVITLFYSRVLVFYILWSIGVFANTNSINQHMHIYTNTHIHIHYSLFNPYGYFRKEKCARIRIRFCPGGSCQCCCVWLWVWEIRNSVKMVGWYVWYYNACPYSIGFLFTVLELDYQLLCHVLYCSYQQAQTGHMLIVFCFVVFVVYCIVFFSFLSETSRAVLLESKDSARKQPSSSISPSNSGTFKKVVISPRSKILPFDGAAHAV